MKILPILLFLGIVLGNAFADETPASPKSQIKIIEALRPSLVQVEYHLKHDKGELPIKSGWGERCASCGQYHSNGIEDSVKNEQPLATVGYVVGENRIINHDLQMHPRFIKSIHVRQGSKLVPARIISYGTDQNAAVLELLEKLPDAKPLKFEGKSGPFSALEYQPVNGQWNASFKPIPPMAVQPEHSEPFIGVPSDCLLIDKTGAPVALSFKDELPLDDSWKGAPEKRWAMIDDAKLQQLIGEMKKTAESSVVRVQLNFRSSKTTEPANRNSYDREEEDTEKNVTALVIAPNRLLVMTDLKPKVTARLQRISVYGADGKNYVGQFEGSLKDLGALVVKTDSGFEKPIVWSSGSIVDYRNQLLLCADIAVKGEKRVAYYQHSRIASFEFGWRNQVFPKIADEESDAYLFNLKNELIAFPIARREKTRERYRTDDNAILTASAYVKAVLAEGDKAFDPANVPLSEEEENRLAWLGVELQAMTPDLARVNQVSEFTQEGQVGAVVTHVYDGSPASKSGIKVGDILLRLRTDDQPVPIEVKLQDNSYQEGFPWDRLDELQDRYFDRVPSPWPSVENPFIRQLTDLGMGSKVIAEFFHDGNIVEKEFTVAAGPEHYNSAPRYKYAPLGLTVRNVTYEVRRYLQRREEEPGVVISKIEPGSRAAVAGIKPYELITHINNQPVKNVKDFETLVEVPGELNLSVRRMAKGRIVKIVSPAAAGE